MLCKTTGSGVLSVRATRGLRVPVVLGPVKKSNLPREDDWEAIHNSTSAGKKFLVISDFMRKSPFRIAALRVVETSVDVEKEGARK